MLIFLLSIGVMNALVPVLVIIVLIGAAAGLSRGFGFLDLFGIATFMGLGTKSGGKASFARQAYSREQAQKAKLKAPKVTKAEPASPSAAQISEGGWRFSGNIAGVKFENKNWTETKAKLKEGGKEYLKTGVLIPSAAKGVVSGARSAAKVGRKTGWSTKLMAAHYAQQTVPFKKYAAFGKDLTNSQKKMMNFAHSNTLSPTQRARLGAIYKKGRARGGYDSQGRYTPGLTPAQMQGKFTRLKLSSTDRGVLESISGNKEVYGSSLNYLGIRKFEDSKGNPTFFLDPTYGLKHIGTKLKLRQPPKLASPKTEGLTASQKVRAQRKLKLSKARRENA